MTEKVELSRAQMLEYSLTVGLALAKPEAPRPKLYARHDILTDGTAYALEFDGRIRRLDDSEAYALGLTGPRDTDAVLAFIRELAAQ
jgi:hypothetical protein